MNFNKNNYYVVMSVVACVQMPLIIYAAGFLREAFPVDTKTNRHTLLH